MRVNLTHPAVLSVSFPLRTDLQWLVRHTQSNCNRTHFSAYHHIQIGFSLVFQCICDRLPQKQTQLTCWALAISPTKKHQNRINIFSTRKWADWLYTKYGWLYFVNYTKAIFAIRAWEKIFWLEARGTTEWHSILRNIPINGRNFVK